MRLDEKMKVGDCFLGDSFMICRSLGIMSLGKALRGLVFPQALLLALGLTLVTGSILANDRNEGGGQEETGPRGADLVESGRELVSIDFPEPTPIKEIIKAVAMWTGKNVIIGSNVSGSVQIISPDRVTKEEAYQAFLSALNMIGLTTVETGKVIKIKRIVQAKKENIKTYLGASWAPRTDEIITQIIPLKYVDARAISKTLRQMLPGGAVHVYEPTNTLVVSEAGYKIRRVLEILELLDVQTQQPQVMLVPVKYSDPKSIADKVNNIIKTGSKGKSSSSYHSFKIMTDARTSSIIIFGPPRTIKDIKALVKKFDIPIDDPSAQAAIHVRPLDYANATKLASVLSSLASGNNRRKRPPGSRGGRSSSGGATVADLGDGVKITADEASNSLIITGSKAAYEALNSIIRKLDVRRSQVFVEADILDINSTDKLSFGWSLLAGSGSEKGSKQIYGWQGASGASSLVQAVSSTGGVENMRNVANAFASDLSIGFMTGQTIEFSGMKLTPSAIINLMKTDGNATLLSSPHILTSNNEEAKIVVGQTVFYTTKIAQQGVVSENTEKEPVDMTLTIKPNISHSNHVTLKVDIEANRIIGYNASSGLPNIANRKTKQMVTVKNGQTIVMSGLMNTNETETYQKIPFLGDIPILGWLFRNTNKEKQSTNLVVFLTPYIIHGPGDLAAIYDAKLNERNMFFNRIYGTSGVDSELFKRLPSREDGAYRPTRRDKLEEDRMIKQKDEIYRTLGYGREAVQSGLNDRLKQGVQEPDDVNVEDFLDSSMSELSGQGN